MYIRQSLHQLTADFPLLRCPVQAALAGAVKTPLKMLMPTVIVHESG